MIGGEFDVMIFGKIGRLRQCERASWGNNVVERAAVEPGGGWIDSVGQS